MQPLQGKHLKYKSANGEVGARLDAAAQNFRGIGDAVQSECSIQVGSFNRGGGLHPISVKTEVWHQIGIDLVGPLKLTRRGNRYVLFISCILLLVGCL